MPPGVSQKIVRLALRPCAGECLFCGWPWWPSTTWTFLYKSLLATVRARGDIALAVASSGIAALLLQGGRTAHSRLKIPIPVHSSSVCRWLPPHVPAFGVRGNCTAWRLHGMLVCVRLLLSAPDFREHTP